VDSLAPSRPAGNTFPVLNTVSFAAQDLSPPLTLPASVNQVQAGILTQLRDPALSPTQRGSIYIDAVINQSDAIIGLTQTEIANGTDKTVVEAARSVLPTLMTNRFAARRAALLARLGPITVQPPVTEINPGGGRRRQ
jgi:hypothetical protein